MKRNIENWKNNLEIVEYVQYAIEKYNLRRVVAVYQDREDVKEDLAEKYKIDIYSEEGDDKLDEMFEQMTIEGEYFEENYAGAVLKLKED